MSGSDLNDYHPWFEIAMAAGIQAIQSPFEDKHIKVAL
jgi:hypothetical protein